MKKRIHILVLALFALLSLLPVSAIEPDVYVIDETNTFTTEELTTLNEQARELSEKYECGIYIILTQDQNGYGESQYARGTYMNYDLGWGDGASGVLLAIALEERYVDAVAYGAAGDTFTTSTLDHILDDVFDDLSNGNWYGAMTTYLRDCDQELDYSDYHYYEPEYTDPPIAEPIVTMTPEQRRQEFMKRLGAAALGSAVISLIIVLILKASLKNTGIKKSAGGYVAQGGMHLRQKQDYYMYTRRSVTRIPKDNNRSSSGGGGHSYHSSGFSSSSGGRHF